MGMNQRDGDDISVYVKDQEYIANNYVLKCFSVTMLVYTMAFILNIFGIFVVEQRLMWQGYILSLIVYVAVWIAFKYMSPSNKAKKYIILTGSILVHTIAGVFITYHAVLVTLLPFLYATLYSSKRVMWYVYVWATISTVIIVYGGYQFGLCDANMVLLTTGRLQEYVVNGQFILTEVNSAPWFTLFLFFVLPRCLIYVAFMAICNSIFHIVSGSLEKVRLTEELEKAKEEAERANLAKTKFLAKMSHEIRTPINAISGMNEMIIRESVEANIQKYARDVKKSSNMLLNIVNEILDSSKIESGMMELVEGDYQIGSLLCDVYNMFSIKAGEKNLYLEFEIDSSMPCEYYGDDKRIRQILINLLSNGVKYTNQGKVALRVSCRKDGENAILRYSVSDTGIGIKEENIQHIYGEFQRFDVSRNRDVEGSGLGMNIVQQFLKLMGSELQIKSEYEKGSEFSFELVQKIVNETPLGDFEELLNSVTDETEIRRKYRAPKAKVLVVDDYKMNLKVFRGLLKETEIKVSEAQSGRTCLDMLKEETFDLVFLDHMMPEMDGIQTLHEIRKQNLCIDVPIIMLTANALIGDREKYLNEGFHDFLTKPIMPDELDKMILKHLPRQFVLYEDDVEIKAQSIVKQDGSEEKNGVEEQKTVMVVLKEKSYEAICQKLPELDYEKALTICAEDKDLYLEILDDFVQLPVKEELTGFLEKGDYKSYCIYVHGFKNNAYSVGAKEIGDLALELEHATKDHMSEDVASMQEKLFELYDNVCQRYREVDI